MVKVPIYMDNHATTPVDRRVLDAMMPYFSEKFGNAASRNHPSDGQPEEAVDKARNQIAALINAKSKEIIFTSGATESDNLAIKGVRRVLQRQGQPHHYLRDRAQGGSRQLQGAGTSRQGDASRICGSIRTGWSIPTSPQGDHGQDRSDHRDVRQQ